MARRKEPLPPAPQEVIVRPFRGKVDEADLARMARLHVTNQEMAAWFGVTEATLCNEPYSIIIQEAREETRQRLKQKAIQRALYDNSDTMLIFCLKNLCKWSNNDIIEVQSEKTDTGFTIKVVDKTPKGS